MVILVGYLEIKYYVLLIMVANQPNRALGQPQPVKSVGLTGPAGAIGPPGPAGADGATGPAGADGVDNTKKITSLEKKVKELKAIVDLLSLSGAEDGNVLVFDSSKNKFVAGSLE